MKDKSRINDGIKYGMMYTLIIMSAGLIILEIFDSRLTGIFGLSGETKQLCMSAIRIISISFIFAGANIAFQGIFQALNSGMESFIVSVCRQLIFVLPLAWAFVMIINRSDAATWIVWLTFPVAEILSALIAFFLMKRIYNNKVEILA